MKLTFGKSQPWSSGWRGWSDSVEVFVDGKNIGVLGANGCPQKRYLEYSFEGDHPLKAHYPRLGVFGLRKAKLALAAALARTTPESNPQQEKLP